MSITSAINRELAVNRQVTLIENKTLQRKHRLTRDPYCADEFISLYGEHMVTIQSLDKCRHCNGLLEASWLTSWKLGCSRHYTQACGRMR